MACQPKIECVFRVGIFLKDCFARFPRGQLQPVVFSLSCSLRSLAHNLIYTKKRFTYLYYVIIRFFLYLFSFCHSFFITLLAFLGDGFSL
ncbi:hypothetical protein BUZ01_05030 [Staphylococcus gallinarum]|uniref:Uncharacterized protein n=1 Tax=Staphylococcus gallinarum TaxID=1293 RepID=A0A418HQW3_STAGA|nr:hypothetical protein BUY96_12115 [Staphylococcus gallinarum]RIL43996.1 hypothetical protein BUZ01_05030 [Staphylococcus gallinarum]RIO92372.1 hypothetical protein BUZ04_06990 [Staphylococcus gallinarum]